MHVYATYQSLSILYTYTSQPLAIIAQLAQTLHESALAMHTQRAPDLLGSSGYCLRSNIGFIGPPWPPLGP